MDGCINLKSLTLDELVGVVNLYPWFGNARKELCARMAAMSDSVGMEATAGDAALYLPSRKILSDMIRSGVRQDCADKDIDTLLKSYIAGNGTETVSESETSERKVVVVGGDYFSQEEYDRIRKSEDAAFPKFNFTPAAEGLEEKPVSEDGDVPEIYTETLAQIYAEQGYPELAKKIYSKLILAYPEKNTYFAALIRKLEEEN